jgi:hypothetical protein
MNTETYVSDRNTYSAESSLTGLAVTLGDWKWSETCFIQAYVCYSFKKQIRKKKNPPLLFRKRNIPT